VIRAQTGKPVWTTPPAPAPQAKKPRPGAKPKPSAKPRPKRPR
jgi:hypothetical protein